MSGQVAFGYETGRRRTSSFGSYTRVVVIAVDPSDNAKQAFDCESVSGLFRCGTREMTDKLEYLAVYGRASMAAFRQRSTRIVPSRSNVREARLNTHGQKSDPESL